MPGAAFLRAGMCVIQTEDARISDVRPLIPPACLAEEIPLTDKARRTVLTGRKDVQNVIAGKDDRC